MANRFTNGRPKIKAICEKYEFKKSTHERAYKSLGQDKIDMIHAASTVFWTDVPRGGQCILASLQKCGLLGYCELAATVKVTPKKYTWVSVVAVTSRQISKCVAEQSRSRHSNVHDMSRNHWIEIGTFSLRLAYSLH